MGNDPTNDELALLELAVRSAESGVGFTAPSLDAMVAYLANALSPEEAHAVRQAAARHPALRKQLAEVFAVLEDLQAMPLSEIAAEPVDESLKAKVSFFWLALIRRSIQFSLQARLSETRAHVKDLLDAVEKNLQDYWAGLALHGPGATRPVESGLTPAFRSGADDGISLESTFEENGDFVVQVSVSPDHAAEWESQEIEVVFLQNVRLPLRIGAGTIKNGQVKVRAFNLKQLLDLRLEPIDPSNLSVRVAGAKTEDETLIWPIEGAVFSAAECPRLTAPLRVEDGRIHISIEIPPALRHGHPGATLAIDASFTPANWQRILALPLEGAPPTYEAVADCREAQGLSGHIYPPLRFQVIA